MDVKVSRVTGERGTQVISEKALWGRIADEAPLFFFNREQAVVKRFRAWAVTRNDVNQRVKFLVLRI